MPVAPPPIPPTGGSYYNGRQPPAGPAASASASASASIAVIIVIDVARLALHGRRELQGPPAVSPLDAGQVAPIVASFLALATNTPEHFEAGVVERKVETNLRRIGGHVEGLVLDH